MNYERIKKQIKKMLPDFLFDLFIKIWRNISVSKLDIITQNNIIIGALADPNGQGKLNLLLENIKIPKKYKYLFRYSSESRVFVDCGANVGRVIDVARFCNMEVFAFEPNKFAVELLSKKYDNDNKVHLYPVAISNKAGDVVFYSNQYDIYDEGANIISQSVQYLNPNQKYQVKCIRLLDVLNQDILSKHNKIYMLKLDVEGAEFDVLEDIIENKMYKKIEYIVCETHERFFGKEGDKKIEKIKNLIKKDGIKNIYLDWM